MSNGSLRAWRYLFVLALVTSLFAAVEGGRSVAAEELSEAPVLLRGSDVVVGSFELRVDPQTQLVSVRTLSSASHPLLPVTSLSAEIAGWNAVTREIDLSVAVKNTGSLNLMSPQAYVMRLVGRGVRPLNPTQGTGIHSWRWDYSDAEVGGDGILGADEVSTASTWRFAVPTGGAFRVVIELCADVPLAANEGGVIVGEGGVSVIVPPGAVPYEAFIDIAPLPTTTITTPVGDAAVLGAVELTLEPGPSAVGELPSLQAPLQVAIPQPAGTPVDANILVAQQSLTDFYDGTNAGLAQRLLPVGTGGLIGGSIVAAEGPFEGIFGGGIFAFLLQPFNSGYVTGVVRDAGGPRSGAVVSNSTTTLVAVTDGTGRYTLPAGVGLLRTASAFDPLRGTGGSTNFSIPSQGVTTVANIDLAALSNPPVTRDGIRNSGFERGDLSSWQITGVGVAQRQLTCSSATINPTEGSWMAEINTGAGSVGSVGSALTQRFRVPSGVRTLRFDYNFVSEEFPEFVGSQFNDAFRATITTPNGESTVAQVSVNDSGGFTLIGDCGFPGGDSTSGTTGWRTGSVDVSAFSGQNVQIEIDLNYTANDAGDNIYDTRVFIDNIRFGTVWVDVKVINGASADRARIDYELREANEILSQAGLIVRLRDYRGIPDPGGLADADTTLTLNANGRFDPSAETLQILNLARSTVSSDVNVYYVRSFTGVAACGIAFGPDDINNVNFLTNGGVFIPDLSVSCSRDYTRRTLAHELGHLMLSPERAGDTLEHNATSSNFMSSSSSLAERAKALVSRAQSSVINRIGAPYIVP